MLVPMINTLRSIALLSECCFIPHDMNNAVNRMNHLRQTKKHNTEGDHARIFIDWTRKRHNDPQILFTTVINMTSRGLLGGAL